MYIYAHVYVSVYEYINIYYRGGDGMHRDHGSKMSEIKYRYEWIRK